MDVLDKIAILVLEDPFLTASQIAKRLGYAEEKTVYYWVDKAHFSGLTAFKRAVLRGQYPRSTGARESSTTYGHIQIAETFSYDRQPIYNGEQISLPSPDPGVLFAWRYQGEKMAHILPGDLLMVGLLPHGLAFRWALAFTPHCKPVVRLHLRISESDALINPETQMVDADAIPTYALYHLYRPL